MQDKLRLKRAQCLDSIWSCAHLLTTTCWGIFLVAMCFGNVLIVSGEVTERGSLSGIVQLNGQGLPEHRIMLIRFDSAGDVQRTPGQTNALGQFTFENLETGTAFEYVVGIRYAGQLYRSESVRLAAAQHRTGVLVQVVAPSTPLVGQGSVPLLIANHLMVLVLRDHHIEVREVVRVLRNEVESPVQTDPIRSPQQNSLYLPLPHGYSNFAGVQGLMPDQVRLHPSGFTYVAPLESGEHRFVYTYSLPLRTDVTTILSERSVPTTTLDIFVEDERLVAVSDLQFMGRIAIEPHTFWHFRGMNLATHARSWLQVTRRNAPTPILQVGAYVIVVSLTLFGLGWPLYDTWRRRPQEVPHLTEASGQSNALNIARVHLLQAIAQLDDQYQAGLIETTAYKQRRYDCKKQLLHLVQQLRHTSSDKESNGR